MLRILCLHDDDVSTAVAYSFMGERMTFLASQYDVLLGAAAAP